MCCCHTTGCAMDQRPICIDSYSGSLTSSKRRDYYPCGGALQDPFDHGSPSVLMQMPNSSSFHGPPHLQGEGPPSMDEGDGSEYGRPRETRLSSSNTFMGMSEDISKFGFGSSQAHFKSTQKCNSLN